MATITQNFGTNTALTVTNLHSLGDGSYWQSATIDNGTVKGFWVELFITILTTTTAGSADGYIEVYYAGSTDGGTDLAGGASGSEGAYTNSGNNNVKHMQTIDVLPCDASETTARTFKYRAIFRDIGEDFSIVIGNQSGTAIGASTNAVEYRLHKADSA